MIKHLSLSFYLAVVLSTTIFTSITQAQADKPNILFVMSDDHCAQGVGAYGGRLAQLDPTPNIDRLADEGMLFKNVFCVNSICTPSRANIMTGQYCQRNGVLDLGGRLKADKQYLPILMKEAGYTTAMIGKWHLKEEPSTYDYYSVLPGQGKYHHPEFRIRGEHAWPKNVVKRDGQHSSDAITDFSLEWLDNRDKSKPFFLMHHFKAPHDMFENSKRYDSYLEDVEIPEPTNLHNQPGPNFGSVATRGEQDGLIDTIGSSVSKRMTIRNMGKHMDVSGELSNKDYTQQSYQRYLKRYLRCVKGVDDNMARLFDYLEKNDLMDNTIIIYTGDQGFFLGEHDYIDKRWMYDEGMQMPFLVRYPKKIKAGSQRDWLINNTDFAPTMLALAGVDTPDYMQGKSFAKALEGKSEPRNWRKATYYRYWMHMAHRHNNPAHFGVRTKKHKLIFYYGADYKQPNRYYENTPVAWEFYDLEKDPKEMHNRYEDPAYAKVIAKLKKELIRQREEFDETDNDYPHIQAIINANWGD